MKMLYIPSLALILGYAFAAPSSLVPREPSNEPINLHHGPDQGATFNCGTHKYSGHDIYVSVQRGVALQNVGETRGKNKYPHSFDNDDSKGNKLAFPDYCPEDKKRMEFPLITPPPYDGGKNNVKQGDERVVYYYTPGDQTYDGNPNVEYCGIMTHVGAPTGGFFLC